MEWLICGPSSLLCRLLLILSFFQESKQRLEKVGVVREELMSHIRNLPDLTKLPDVEKGLAPLPSAGDLFSQW